MLLSIGIEFVFSNAAFDRHRGVLRLINYIMAMGVPVLCKFGFGPPGLAGLAFDANSVVHQYENFVSFRNKLRLEHFFMTARTWGFMFHDRLGYSALIENCEDQDYDFNSELILISYSLHARVI